MKLYTIEIGNNQKVAVETKAGIVTLEGIGIEVKDMNDLIDRWDSLGSRIKEAISKPLPEPVCDYKLLSPIPCPKQDVICLGVNYRSHFEETADGIDFTKKADTVYFSKRVTKTNNPGGIIPAYDFVERLDYESELGVVLGKDVLNVGSKEAQEAIFGYTVINDVSARDIQVKHQQWYRGKSLDGFTPMGPCIVTADELVNGDNLPIRCYVNGEKRQDSNTKYMITSVIDAIVELSCGMTLQKGTVIATGTPGGVGMGMKPPVFLKSGDKVACEIEGIGILENTVGC